MSKEDDRQVIKFIQDLKWVLESPSLLSPDFFPEDTINLNVDSVFIIRLRNYFLPKIASIDFSSNDVLGFLKQRPSNRLGKYYEFLLEFLFLNYPDIDLIYKGLPLREDHSKTIGEFDFILYDRQDRKIIHLEVAVKFYLKLKIENLTSSYIGPSFNDRLDKKMDKLLKQTRLSELPPAESVLGKIIQDWSSKQEMEIQFPISLQRLALIQGRLFYPYKENKIFPDSLNLHHSKSYFITFDQLNTQKKFLRKFLILPRLDWLAEPSSYKWQAAMYFNGLQKLLLQQMKKHNTSVYVLSKDFNSEIRSFFVLPDSIPHLPL